MLKAGFLKIEPERTMRRENFPSSVENVEAYLSVAKSGKKLDSAQRKALRDYLAGATSSNTLSLDTSKRIGKIREILGMPPLLDYSRDSVKKSIAQGQAEKSDETEKQPTHWAESINGIHIIMGRPWDDMTYPYELYLPQTKLGDVQDQILICGDSEADAKKIYDKACELAKKYDLTTLPKVDKSQAAAELQEQVLKFIKTEIRKEI